MSAQIEHGPLAGILRDAAAGRFPPANGEVTVLPPSSPRDSGVIGFTAHAVVFSDADPAWVGAHLPDDDPSRPLSPAFLQALCAHTRREAHTIDMLCAASSRPGQPGLALRHELDVGHPRIARAMRYRDDVRAWRTEGGVMLIGRGVASRWEVAIEVDPGYRGKGLGRALACAARHLVPGDGPVWAQIAPANAASVRAFLAAGFRPVGAEALLTHGGLGV
jgi:GNAT superfamily N-acetyltransferase